MITGITEDYVSFETAKLLKEREFSEPTYHDYDEKGRRWFEEVLVCHNLEGGIACPTLQMAMKWLREVYNKSIEIRSQGLKGTSIGWIVEIYNLINQDEEFHHPYTFSTYEEACEAAIKYCLENLV